LANNIKIKEKRYFTIDLFHSHVAKV